MPALKAVDSLCHHPDHVWRTSVPTLSSSVKDMESATTIPLPTASGWPPSTTPTNSGHLTRRLSNQAIWFPKWVDVRSASDEWWPFAAADQKRIKRPNLPITASTAKDLFSLRKWFTDYLLWIWFKAMLMAFMYRFVVWFERNRNPNHSAIDSSPGSDPIKSLFEWVYSWIKYWYYCQLSSTKASDNWI